MARRFFIEPPLAEGSTVLSGAEAHHAAHVMRIQSGDQLTLFDGSGREAVATVTRVQRNALELDVDSPHQVDRELARPLTVGVALPKPERQRWLVEKLVELGVTRLVPLIASRSVARPNRNTLNRLSRTVIEASKQCGRNRLLEVGPPQPFSDYLTSAPESSLRLVAHSGGGDWPHLSVAGREVYCAVGPEGGLTDDELASSRAAGWQTVSLGRRTLRVETACLSLCSVLSIQLEQG